SATRRSGSPLRRTRRRRSARPSRSRSRQTRYARGATRRRPRPGASALSQIAQPLPPIAARGVAESAWKRRLPSLLVLALVRAVLGVALALLLAWAISRTNVPARRLFHGVMLISFFLPLLPQLVAWSLLLSPRTGTLNVWIRALVGSDALSGPFNIYSYEGIIFLGVLG